MQIFLILKCANNDAFSFISQVINNPKIDKVTVFRDTESVINDKVDYITPVFRLGSPLKIVFRLVQILKKRNLKPKIIIGIYEIPHGLLAVLASKILKIPSVVSIIGNPAYIKLRHGFRMKITMSILRNASFITVTGSKSRQFLIDKAIPAEKIFILPNSLDFSFYNKSRVAEKRYDIISLGRISKEKHVEVIVKIVSFLKERIPNIKCAIAGSGPEFENIQSLARQLNLSDNIVFPGYIPIELHQNYFNSGRVFVLTSETEGFPRTIIQAAACEIPVVAANVGDMTDIIEHEQNGFLVNDYRNVEEYSDRIHQLLKDDALYNRFAENLNKKVRERFITENGSKIWDSIIKRV